MNLIERRNATMAVWQRFRRRAFDWKTGGTCIHLARAQMVAMGHKPPRIPPFRSALGARRAMDRAGFADLGAMLESLMLPEIAPAHMWVGDLAILPGHGDGFDAIGIWSGAEILGYHANDPSGIKAVMDAMGGVTRAFRL